MISRKACSTVRRSGHDVDGNVADSRFTNTSPWNTPHGFPGTIFSQNGRCFFMAICWAYRRVTLENLRHKNGLIKIENMLLKFKFGDITG